MPQATPREYFRRHSALSDWLRPANAEGRDAILAEDLTRAERLATLHRIIGLPVLSAMEIDGRDLERATPEFTSFIAGAQGAFAVRAVRKDDETRVVRNRNLSARELVDWLFATLGDLSDYSLEFSPHIPNEWASIFVVTDAGIVGEVTEGSLRQLTQGDNGDAEPATFTFDFHKWSVVPNEEMYQTVVERAVKYTYVMDENKRHIITAELGTSFTNSGYLQGYFEVIVGPGNDMRFIDFNVTLGRQLDSDHWDLLRRQQINSVEDVHGLTASRGKARGRARVVFQAGDPNIVMNDGDVLICVEPTPEMVPLLVHASGMVADRGGVLSHAAIVCRELRVPCIVGTHTATENISDGSLVEVDADAGVVRTI